MFARLFLSDSKLLRRTRISALYSAYTRRNNCTIYDLYECGDENCIPYALVCNGKRNCPYGRDEALCHLAQDAIVTFAQSGFFPLACTIFIVSIGVYSIIFWTYRLKMKKRRRKMGKLPQRPEERMVQVPGIVVYSASINGNLSD
ncbi:hypothetical protein WR25_00331 [Diploscapter pachys]|uniref:EB domain-containing protein n=1 Tax=Diploscapter pachys TaxID=2018661 RepID=A0A2A2L6Y4_9BILA|nr:hypothetical protein WR25_00331 [Diploscapter pachys]